MKKSNLWLGIMAIALVLGMTVVGCDNGSSGDNVPQTVTYQNTDTAGNTYILTITEKTSRAAYTAVAGDSYVLIIKNASEPDKISKGTISAVSVDFIILTLLPDTANAPSFSVTIILSDGKIIAIIGPITLENGETVEAGDFEGGNSGGTVSVTGVELDPTTLNLTVGGSAGTLTATVTPDNATDKTVTWNSSNTGVATVSDGTVTPVAQGTATVTVTTNDGKKTATCTVTVSATAIPVTFSSVTQNGSATATTTQLTLTFDRAITGLTAGNITLSGVTGVKKETLSGSGPSYTLKISGVTAGGNLIVTVSNPSGYTISGSSQWVTIYYYSGSGGNASDFTYTETANAVTITGYKGTASSVSIPAQINGKPVTVIGGVAFGSTSTPNTSLTSVTIPNSVTTIGEAAFYLCTSLTSVTIPDSVTTIEESAFDQCTSLTSITIPNGLTRIENFTFSQTGLTSITIPAGVTSIGYSAFYQCTSLASVKFEGTITSDNFHSDAFEWNNDLRTKYLAGGTGTYTRSGAGTTASPYTWSKQSGSGNNDNVFTSIAAMAAWLADQPANTVAAPYNVKLNVSALDGSSSTAGSAGAALKANNTKFVNLDLSGSIFTSIEGSAFSSCASLVSVTIGSGVTSIMNGVFGGCTNLATINIPDSVFSIDFEFCYGTAWYDNQPNGLVYVGKVALLYKGTMPANTSITLLEGTKGIAAEALYGLSNLKSITIPASVTNIGGSWGGSFYNCTGLTSVTFERADTIIIGSTAFINAANTTSLQTAYTTGGIGTYTRPNTTSTTWMKQSGGGTAPTITTTTLPHGTVEIAYSQTLTATGDTPITWSLDSGALPAGLALSAAGVISGTPTAIGTSNFTVKATNTIGNNTKQLSIRIIGNVFTSAAEMAAWLGTQTANTAATAYTVKLNVADLTEIGNALYTNNTKYVNLDLSGSTFTSIMNNAFSGGEGKSCTGLTSVTIPNSVTIALNDSCA